MEVDQPKMLCSKLIQKQIDCDGVTWYSTTQEADIRAWLIEEDMTLWGCRTVQAPIPDKDEMLDAMRSVTPQEHKWIRSNHDVGSMGYYAVQTRWDIA